MSLGIAGIGWVTPLGCGIAPVWNRLLAGESAMPERISTPISPREYPVYRVPAAALGSLPPHPRLRRSSAISRFAAAAGVAALEDAGVQLTPATAQRTALIFAVSNGGVIYTKRFYHEIVESGPQAASPLLFPETVFNAPASHLAAILEITGTTYTLVGDGAVGLLALKMADDLMQSEMLDRCLVVGAEEADWLLCDAYRKWRLMRMTPPIEPFRMPARGMILSEGAGAVLITRSAAIQIDCFAPGGDFYRQRDAAHQVDKIVATLSADVAKPLVIASANGTFIDRAEQQAISKHLPDSIVFTPKPALGEGIAAGGLWQVICAAQALRSQQLPPVLNADDGSGSGVARKRLDQMTATHAVVSTCGMNQQAAGLRLQRSSVS